VKTRLCVLAVVALVIWGMKRHYADARADDLSWILSPTTQLVEVMTGASFAWQPGEGYFSRDRMFLIEKSCAGINFMIAAFGLVVFALLRRVESGISGVAVLGSGLLVSYGAAVLVNAARITIALWLGDHPITLSTLTAADLHRLEGIVVYFGGLMLLYELVQRLDRSEIGTVFRRTALPLAVYYAVTLAIPLANGAAQSGAFAAHALVVLVVPPAAIIVACAVHWVAHAVVAAYRQSI
jgi:exosortase K